MMGTFWKKIKTAKKGGKYILLSESGSVNKKMTHEYILVNSACSDFWTAEYLCNSSLVVQTIQGCPRPKHYGKGRKCI